MVSTNSPQNKTPKLTVMPPACAGGSTFKEVFEGFLEEIKDTVVELEQSMGDMKKKYTIATSHFAEASSVEPETFFGYFNTFIMQYSVSLL